MTARTEPLCTGSAASAQRQPIVIVGAGMAGFAVARELKARGALSRDKPAATLLQAREACETQYGVRIIPHLQVTGLDTSAQQLTTASGATFNYEHLVLATGAVPLAPWAGPGIFSVNSASDMCQAEPALARAERVLVAGAGFVGLELANDWQHAGKFVTVVSTSAPLHPLLPASASEWVQSRLEDAGVVFKRGHLALTAEEGPVRASVDGAQLQPVFDLALSAVGLRSSTALAQTGGFVTSDPRVLALGDGIEQGGRPWRYVAAINHAAKVIASRLTRAALPVAPARLPIPLKCPDAPLAMVLPSGTATVHWEQVVLTDTELELRASVDGAACGYVLGGQATSRRAQLDAWLATA